MKYIYSIHGSKSRKVAGRRSLNGNKLRRKKRWQFSTAAAAKRGKFSSGQNPLHQFPRSKSATSPQHKRQVRT